MPEGDSGSGSYVEGVDAMGHGDADDIIGRGDGGLRKTVALGAHDDGETRLGSQDGVVEGYGLVGEGHRHRLKAKVGERRVAVEPRPGHQEHRTHGYPHGSSVERVARLAGEQHGIDAQGCRRAEDGSDIGGVDHAIDDHHTTGSLKDVGQRLVLGSAHGTEHAPRQGVTRELRQEIAVASIDGDVRVAVDDIGRIASDMSSFAEQGHRLVASIEGHTDDLGALGDEESFLGGEGVSQLRFGQLAEDLHAWVTQRGYFFYHKGHTEITEITEILSHTDLTEDDGEHQSATDNLL